MPYGTVKSKKGELATILLERQDMCGECHACELLSGKKACQLTCECQIECEVGDKVEVALTNNRFLKATYIMYGVPFVGLIVGLFIGYGAGLFFGKLSELGGIIGAIMGMLLGLYWIKVKERKKEFKKYLPKIISKY